MKASEIHQMTPAEVEQLLKDKIEELANFRMQLVTRQVDNPLLVRQARRDVARIKTALREHELGVHPLPGDAGAAGKTEEQKGT
jgi:large subunit ribosomal protein L29